MNNCSEINNLVKKSIFLGVIDNLNHIRSLYLSGDKAQGDFLFTNLIESLNEYKNEIGKEGSTF